MATKSFLSSEQFAQAGQRIGEPGLGQWLETCLLERLAGFPSWRKAMPIALGSLARGEICPKSDIDLLFAGEEAEVREWMMAAQASGLKVRGRFPEDPSDWTKGVEIFDSLALLRARALVPEAVDHLERQQQSLRQRLSELRGGWRKGILKERDERRARHDSVTSYLEPNLKFGPGGLRDTHQALDLILLYPELFKGEGGTEEFLKTHVQFLVRLRRQLQVLGGSDILAAGMQLDLAQAAGHENIGPWMGEVQREMADASFWADWVAAMTARSRSPKIKVPQSYAEALGLLEKRPDILHQAVVRRALPELTGHLDLPKAYHPEMKESTVEALFRSQLLDQAIPDLSRLRGYVQHDHYHRFTADQHLYQVAREVLRARSRPGRLGGLRGIARALSEEDWTILLWAAIYHDLGKGLGGDHEQKGLALVHRDGGEMGWSKSLISEVQWLVEHHLVLSQAAFRGRADDQNLWRQLHDLGATGRRLARLTIFTAVDIRGTNPEAWNDWKERLLREWYDVLSAETTQSYLELVKEAPRGRMARLAEKIDPVVAKAITKGRLLKDLKSAAKAKQNLPPLVHRNRRGELWVRFHERHDRPGVFLELVRRLYALGLSVTQSSVGSLPGVGVYDWFEIKSSRDAEVIRRQLAAEVNIAKSPVPVVRFREIQVVGTSDQEVILSFRGPDQRGVLLAAAQALYDQGLSILWARVHTWGHQIDDVFAVVPHENLEQIVAHLRAQFAFSPVTK